MTSLAAREREALLDLMADAGPHAPTLLGDWTTHDLAAHLVVRERRPLAVPGYVLAPLHGLSARFEARTRRRQYEDLLALLRRGAPVWSPVGSPVDAVDDLTNLHEFFVHHEDVRRVATPEPRALSRELEDALWARARVLAPVFTRRARGVGIELVTPAAQAFTVRSGRDRVVVRGRPGELFLWLWGRPADVSLEGAVDRLAEVQIGP
ncbi:MAG: hypothetical protein JWN17_882 [Frankiales bacterium]|nr:hypothetical protein [Frankiales bacterium]